jgi:hypothetical protein
VSGSYCVFPQTETEELEFGTTELLLDASLDELGSADELNGTDELLLDASLEELAWASRFLYSSRVSRSMGLSGSEQERRREAATQTDSSAIVALSIFLTPFPVLVYLAKPLGKNQGLGGLHC